MKKQKMMGIRTKLFLYMLCMIFAMTGLVDVIVYRIYKEDIRQQVILSEQAVLRELAENVESSVRALEENMLYKIGDSGMFDYQEDLAHASSYSIERNMQNFAALMNNRDFQVKKVYLRDAYGCSFYYDKESTSHELLQDFMQMEAARYINNNYELLRKKRGATFWRSFEDDADSLYLIKSTLNQKTLLFEGILCVVIEKKYLESMEKNLKSPLAVYDENQELLYCKEEIADTAQAYETQLQGGEAGEEYEEYFVTQASLSRKGWTLCGFTARDRVLARMRELLQRMFAIEAGFLLVSLLAAAGISRSMTYNISALIENFRRINRGEEAQWVAYHSNDETAYLCDQFNDMNAQLQQYIEEQAINSTQREKAEYNALMAQMNPHFLYNSLESVSSMAKLRKQPDIVAAVNRLSKLLRASISGDSQEIALRQELDYVGQYLELQRLVSGERFDWETVAEEGLLDCRVPKLILQPIVENAVIHGLKDVLQNGIIIIMVRREQDTLLIEVCDNGAGMDESLARRILQEEEPRESRRDRAHIGLKSIQRRIAILYGNDGCGVEIESPEDGGAVVRIRLPYREEKD